MTVTWMGRLCLLCLRRISCLNVAMTILGRLLVLSAISCQIYLHRCLRCPGFRCRQALQGRPDYNLSFRSMCGYVLGRVAALLYLPVCLLGTVVLPLFFIYGSANSGFSVVSRARDHLRGVIILLW